MSDEPLPPSNEPSPLPPGDGHALCEARKKNALLMLPVIALLLGAIDVMLFGAPTTTGTMGATPGGPRLLVAIAGNIALLVTGFRWLYWDSLQLDIRRPAWLNVGIILVAIVFVPYYLYKTRPEGRRLLPIAAFFALIVVVSMANVVGAGLAEALPGPNAVSTPTI